MPALLRQLWKKLGAVEGFAEGSNVFSDDDDSRAYFVHGTQVANLVDDDVLALRLTRKVWSVHRQRLRADHRVERTRPNSDWFAVIVESRRDFDFALELAELTAAAHRPAAGVPLKPPPTGADLARRRRFH